MIKIIPSLTVMNGKTVRLTQGDFDNETVYDESPLDVAKRFEDHGMDSLHLVDLEGAQKGTPVNYHVLEVVSVYTSLKVNFAGGIHTDGDISKAYEYGADSITSATIAVYDQELFNSWIVSYGREKICLGADSLEGNIRIGGWQRDTDIKLMDHIEYFHNRGLKYVKTTDISRDGTLEGPSFDLYRSIKEQFPDVFLYASGGVRNVDDIIQLDQLGIDGIIFGKAYYEGKLNLKDLERVIIKA